MTLNSIKRRVQDLESQTHEKDTFKVIIYEPGTIPAACERYDVCIFIPDNKRARHDNQ